MGYANGAIPLSRLRHLGGQHYLPAGTAARWLWMVAQGKAKYGVTLRITPGPNAYRWLQAQKDARREACARGRCNDASVAGFSTHGGVWDGRECMAIDVNNWRDLAPGDEKLAWARFAALCRLAGFTVLLFAWEQWHITDFNNVWAIPAFISGGNSAAAAKPAPVRAPEEADMIGIYNTDNPNEATRRAIVGEFSFQVISPWMSGYQWPLMTVKNVNQSGWDATKQTVIDRRASVGMPKL